MATQQVKIKVNSKNQVKFNVQPQKVKFNVNANGRPGKDGETPEFQIGAVVTLPAGENAKVEIDKSSTKFNQILNFSIPQGLQGIEGQPGKDGIRGQDGYTPVKGIDYFDGEPGPEGRPGKDGYTPVKGVDYFDGEPGPQGEPGKDYVLTEDDKEEIAEITGSKVNVENGLGVNSLQQKLEAESWVTTNEKVKAYVKSDIANGDGGKIVYEDLGDENYSIKVVTNGKSAFNQNGKSQTVGGKSHTEGSKNIAFESNAHAEGNETFAGGKHSHAEGNTTASIGNASHSEGFNTVAIGIAAHTEGSGTEAIGDFGHAEGALTHANASSAHAEGLESIASGLASHAEGGHTEATENCAHAEGYYTHAIGQYTHAEGCETTAEGGNAHAEGRGTHAEGWESHAEGGSTYAMGGTSHAEGDTTVAIGGGSHAEGYHTVATADHSHAEGRYNEIDEDGNYVHIVGNGYYDEVNKKEVRSNAHTIDWLGNGMYAGNLKINRTQDVAVKGANNNFTAAQTINGTLTVNGDIVQNGQVYETHAEKLYTKNDEIITRDGATGGLSIGEYTGIIAKKYDGANDGRLGFNANGEARVGDIGDEQPLLTRDELENLQTGQVLTWDGDNLKAIGSSVYVKNTDYATKTSVGVVKASEGGGIGVSSSGNLFTVQATNTEIDEKTNTFKPIVPSNLDYAVKSIGDGYYTKETDYATSSKAGVVRPANGLFMSGNTGALVIAKASNAQIDAKTDSYYPIVPSNLDYAVKSVGDGYYVKNNEYATTSTVGVVKANGSGGITVNSAGNISVVKATDEEINAKTNAYKAIVPANLDYAVKSVGDGYYVKNDDYISSTSAGIAKLESGLGIWANTSHALHIAKASEAEIDAKTNNYKPIVPSNLEYAVKSVGDIVIDCTQTVYQSMTDIPRFNRDGEAITDGVYDASCVGLYKIKYLVSNTEVTAIMEQYLYGATLYQKLERSSNAYFIRHSGVSTWSTYHHSIVIDNLTSSSGTVALSGKQGKILNDRLTAVENSQVELTQDEYDDLLAAGEIDENIYYNIVEE